MQRMPLDQGWMVLQDQHDLAEELGIWRPDFEPEMIHCLSPWQAIPRLAHLQLLLSDQPYYGRHLRGFNEHAWWYRLRFRCPEDLGRFLRLRFDGVDYYAEIWLNGAALGTHEGYADGFAFGIDRCVRRQEENVLVVKVSSPWDTVVHGEKGVSQRLFAIARGMIKGTYEHADTFIQRDVNPIGIHAPVWLEGSDACFPEDAPRMQAALAAGGTSSGANHASSGRLTVLWPVHACLATEARVSISVQDEDSGERLHAAETMVQLSPASPELRLEARLEDTRPWSTWDRRGAQLYRVRLELHAAGAQPLISEQAVGFRTVEVVRDERITELRLNGERVFLRGTAYMPDVYLSQLDRARWRRDLEAMVAHGMNAVRVHVHQQPDGFYEECDRLGLLVMQDFDLNWSFPDNEAFAQRAETLFRRMVQRLRSHPCIYAWVCANEIWPEPQGAVAIANRLAKLAARRSTSAARRRWPIPAGATTTSRAATCTATPAPSTAAATPTWPTAATSCSANSASTPRPDHVRSSSIRPSPTGWRRCSPAWPSCTTTNTA